MLGFLALTVWQVQRRAWKLDLIARVDGRVHAAPQAAPPPTQWPLISAARDEYRHVELHGRYLPAPDTLVQANTDLGAGFWVLSPLRAEDGSIVFVNRGFVPAEQRQSYAPRPPGLQDITGLLRLDEPKGSLLRRNQSGRWYSRDVVAMGAAIGLPAVAPYFVDADGPGRRATTWPAGGLTVIRFPNNHLVYALTWAGLALLCGYAVFMVWRSPRRVRGDS